ncbi:MAG: hypothetical protein P4L11_13615 [Geothrix sp.]|nr:hypothetical protein [Geothrix sp.]
MGGKHKGEDMSGGCTVKIQVEFLNSPSREPEIHSVSRVPVVNETLVTEHEDFDVKRVTHCLDAEDGYCSAIVHVKKRADINVD